MKKKLTLIGLVVGILTFSSTAMVIATESEYSPETAMREAAKAFVKVVDENDAAALEKMLHPQMVQYVQLGEKLIPFAAADFIQMVADKKIGGTPREVRVKSASTVRGNTAQVILKAISDEYDFMYQLSMVESGGEWLIVGILVDIQEV